MPGMEPALEMKQPAELPGVGEVYIRRLNVRHPARVNTEGLELRWNWGRGDRGGYRYAFIIGPNGKRRYLDFDLGEEREDGRVTATPRMRYTCMTDADRRARIEDHRARIEGLRSGRKKRQKDDQ